MKLIDLSDDNQLIFLGDYIDLGPDSCEVIQIIMKLQKQYGEKIIVLRGNHEEMFMDFLAADENDWLSQDRGLSRRNGIDIYYR